MLFRQFPVLPDTEEEIRALFRLFAGMLEDVPVYRFVNRGDDASTALLRRALSEENTPGTFDGC